MKQKSARIALALYYIILSAATAHAQNTALVKDGYYRLITYFKYTEGTKAMYATKDKGGWKTLDEDDCTFVWRIDYDADTEAYKMYNAGTEGRFGIVRQSHTVKMSAEYDSIETELHIYSEGTTDDGKAIITMRRVDQAGEYEFIHQNNHQGGLGSGGTLVGWNESALASQWELHPVSDAEAQELIEAYKPIRDDEALQEAYSELSAAIGNLSIACATYSETASATVLAEAKLLYDEVRKNYHSKAYDLQEVYEKIREIRDVMSRLKIPKDEEPVMEDDDSLGHIRFYHLTDGSMIAIPRKYILYRKIDKEGIHLTLPDTSIIFPRVHVVKESNEYLGELPVFESFKFNDKFNDQLFDDAVCNIDNNTDSVSVTVIAIGKRLTPSFKVADGVSVYVNGKVQRSKKDSFRFDHDRKYQVCRNTEFIYKAYADSSGYAFVPYGRNYTVHVEFPTDNPKSEYGLPILRINTFDGGPITSKQEYKYASFALDGAGIWEDIVVDTMQIRGRGNSTWSYSKKPYRLKFPDKIHPFGMKGGKSWVLLANAQSGAMLTNAIAMKMADMVGSSGCNHIMPVEVYLNDEYIGSYNFTEKIGFANNSIDIDDETLAVMLELDVNYDEAWRFHDKSYNLPVNVKHFGTDDEPEYSELTLDDIKSAFNEFTSTVASGDGSYIGRVDIDKLVKAEFVTDFTRNTELNHPKSWYLYNENIFADSLWIFGPVWDFDWAFGYTQDYTYFKENAEASFFDSSSSPFFDALWHGSDIVKKAYYKLWTDFIKGGGLTKLTDFCDDYYQFVSQSFAHNATRWGNGNSYFSQVEDAKNWLRQRAAYIYGSIEAYSLDEDEEEDTIPPLPDEIQAVTSDFAICSGIYTLQGQFIQSTNISSLPSGIYIINGKKRYVIN